MRWSVFTDLYIHPKETANNEQLVGLGGLLVGTVCILASPFLILNGATLLGWALLPISMVYFCVPLLNKINQPTLAKWALFLNFNVGAFIYLNLLGHGLGMEYLFIASILASQFLFKHFKTKSVAAAVVLMFVLIGDFNILIPIEQMTLTDSQRNGIRLATLPGTLVIIIVAVVATYLRYDRRVKELKVIIELARTDDLTQVGNRFSFRQDNLSDEIKKTDESCLILLDLDGLKAINDDLGHRAGDEFLISFSDLLKSYFEDGRHYRFGGDEFVVWVQTPKNIDRKLEMLQDDIRNYRGHNSGVSYGVTYGHEVETVSQMIDSSDIRMYQHKAAAHEMTRLDEDSSKTA